MDIFIGSSKEVSENQLLLKIAAIVQSKCGINPIKWDDMPSPFEPGKFILESLEELLDKVDASIFICSEDDEVWYRGEKVGQPRDNVIFEHGLFSGKLGRQNSIIVTYGEVKLPTDLNGITYINFSKGNELKGELELISRLKTIKPQTRDKVESFLSLNSNVLSDENYQVDYNNLFTDEELDEIDSPRRNMKEQFKKIDDIWTKQIKSLKKDCQRLIFIYEKLVFLSYFPYNAN